MTGYVLEDEGGAVDIITGTNLGADKGGCWKLVDCWRVRYESLECKGDGGWMPSLPTTGASLFDHRQQFFFGVIHAGIFIVSLSAFAGLSWRCCQSSISLRHFARSMMLMILRIVRARAAADKYWTSMAILHRQSGNNVNERQQRTALSLPVRDRHSRPLSAAGRAANLAFDVNLCGDEGRGAATS